MRIGFEQFEQNKRFVETLRQPFQFLERCLSQAERCLLESSENKRREQENGKCSGIFLFESVLLQ